MSCQFDYYLCCLCLVFLKFLQGTLPCGSQLLTYVSPKRRKFKAKSKLSYYSNNYCYHEVTLKNLNFFLSVFHNYSEYKLNKESFANINDTEPINSKKSILPVRISVWIKSKRSDTYCIAEIIYGPTQIVSLRPRIFRPKKKLSVFLQKNLKPIQKVLLRSESFWINRNVPLCLRQFLDQI